MSVFLVLGEIIVELFRYLVSDLFFFLVAEKMEEGRGNCVEISSPGLFFFLCVFVIDLKV